MNDHYRTLDWICFTRGWAKGERAQAMRDHLASGCEPCRAEHGFWTLLAATFETDRETVPESWLQRAALAPRRFARPVASEPSHIGIRLGFDNFAYAGAAVRGSKPRRHCVYHLAANGGRELNVEVTVERLNARDEWSVVGQILAEDGAEWRQGEIQLSRDGGDSVISQTDESGEFSFVRRDSGPWQLRLRDAGRLLGVVPVLMPRNS